MTRSHWFSSPLSSPKCMWGLCVCPVGCSTGQRHVVPASSHSSQLGSRLLLSSSSCPRPLSSHPWTSAVACSLYCCSSCVLILVHPTCWCRINTLKTLIDMWSFSWSFNGKPLQGPENSWSWLPFSTRLPLLPDQTLHSSLSSPVAQACAHTVLLP